MAIRTLSLVITDETRDDPALRAGLAIAEREDAHLDLLCLGVEVVAVGDVADDAEEVAAGARGLKIYKGLGMDTLDVAGQRIAAKAILDDRGVAYVERRYLDDPPSAEELGADTLIHGDLGGAALVGQDRRNLLLNIEKTRRAIAIAEEAGIKPSITVRQGDPVKAVTELLQERENISALVLAAAREGGPGPLVSHFAGSVAGMLPCPLIIVPGGLDEETLARLS